MYEGGASRSSSSSAPCSRCSFRCCRQMRMPVAATAVAMMAAMMPPMMPPVAHAPAVLGVSRTRTSCSARPVPTALVTVQMKVVLTRLSTVWMSSCGPCTTAAAGNTPEVVLQS